MFEDEEDLEADNRSIQSEEAMRAEDHRELTTEQIKTIEERKQQREEEKLNKLGAEMKDRFNMQDFDIEIKKIDHQQQ